MPYCTNCGHDNPEGANFCGNCGQSLASSGSSGSSIAPGGDRIGSGDTTRTIAAMPEERDGDGLSAEDESAVSALPAGSALLIVQRGSNAGSRYLLNTPSATAGRHPESDVFLDDISVSRRHAVFTRTPNGTVVKDAGSLNGTYVNRDLVDEALLRHGDEVQIGKFRLVYFASPQDPEQA